MAKEPLTHFYEDILGFVGLYPKGGFTGNGKVRMYFDISTGIDDPENLRFANWRRCKAFGEPATILKDIKRGDRVLVYGFMTTEPARDAAGKIKHAPDGSVEKKEYLVVKRAEIIGYERQNKLQLPLVGEAVVGQPG